METKNTFEEWFHEIECFSLKSERFFGDCDHYMNSDDEIQKREGEKIFLAWLKAAFEAGKDSVNK